MPAMPMQSITVSATSFASSPDISLDFEPTEWLIVNLNTTAGDDVAFSFDGVNTHGKVMPATPIAGVSYKFRAKKIWFKDTSATGAAPVVLVMASTDR